MEPISYAKDYAGHVYHQVYVDPASGKAICQQTAVYMDGVAEIFGTMKQPMMTETMLAQFWEHFQEALRARGIKRLIGKMPHHLFEHYHRNYGMTDSGQREASPVGSLVVAEKYLEGT